MEHLASLMATIVNPALGLLFLFLLFADRRPYSAKIAHLLISLATVGVASYCAEYSKSHVLLPGHDGFPSGHETFAMSLILCTVYWRPHLWWIVAPIGVVMGWALKTAQYHDALDIAGAALLAGTVCLLSMTLYNLVQVVKRRISRVPT